MTPDEAPEAVITVTLGSQTTTRSRDTGHTRTQAKPVWYLTDKTDRNLNMELAGLVVLSSTSLQMSSLIFSTHLRVSSAPAETTVLPSGERERLSTLSEWPINSAVLSMLGNFQMMTSLLA